MKKLLKSNVCGSCEQCTRALFTQKSQQSQLKKKKKKNANAKRHFIWTQTPPYRFISINLHHGFKNQNGQRSKKETDYQFYGLTGSNR